MAGRAKGPVDPRLLRRAKATRPFLIAGVTAGSATALLITYQAWLLSSSIADVVAGAGHDLSTAAMLLVAVLAGRAALAFLTTWLSHRAAAAVKSQLRTDILRARLRAPGATGASSSTVVTLMTQGLDALDGYFSKYLPQLVLAVTVPLITGAAILLSDLQAAAIVAATIPLIPLFMALVGWRTADLVRRRWRHQTRLARHFADLVAGLPTLQVFGRARAQLAGLRRTEEGHRAGTLRTLRVSFLSAFVLELLSSLAVAVIAVTVGTRLVYGMIDFRVALFVLILVPEVYLPIRQVGVHYHDSADGVAAAEAAFAEIDKAAALGGSGVPEPGELVVVGVSKTWPGSSEPALPRTSLVVQRGEVVALAGPTGSGKSTLVQVILGFCEPTSGFVSVSGASLESLDLDQWRAQVAYVGQTPGLVRGTVADNVRLGNSDAGDGEVRSVLDRSGAPDLGLSVSVGDEGEGLSAGERRRVAIARALLKMHAGAWLLVLDEPTAGLDADAEAIVLAGLRDAGGAVLVVSHRESVLEAADRVVRLAPTPTLNPPPPKPTPVAERSDGSVEIAAISTNSPDPIDPPPGPEDAPAAADPRTNTSIWRLLSRLLTDVPKGPARLLAAILLAAAASGAAVSLLAVSAWLISKAAEHPSFLELSVAAVGVRFFGISRACFRYLERLVGHDLALRMQTALRLRTYGRLSRTTLLGRRRGDLLVRVVADVEAVQDVVVRVALPFAAAMVVVAGTTAILSGFSFASAMVLLTSALVAGLLVPLAAQWASRTADADVVRLRGELGTSVHDTVRAATDLVAFGATGRALAEAECIDSRLAEAEQRASTVRAVAAAAQVLAAGSAVVGGLVIGAIAVTQGAMAPALLAVLVLTPLALHEVLAALTQSAQTATRARAALRRVGAVLTAPLVGSGDAATPPPAESPSLLADDVRIGWPTSGEIATGDISFTLRPGESIAVVGRSGAGKTTLAATVLGLIPPVAGRLESTGRIGYLAQDAHIFATTLAENVRIGNKDATDDEVVRAMAAAGLYLAAGREVGELGATLSGGEARRLALARLLVGDYRLLVLDEPTEHLDRETALALVDDIWRLVDSRPILVMTHDAEVVRRCDRVVRLTSSAANA